MCSTTPAGVVIATATQSGMLCVTRRNSIVNVPTVTRSRGATRISRETAASPNAASFGSTSASVSAVPYTGPSMHRHHVRNGADVVLVPVRQDHRPDRILLQLAQIRDDQIHAQQLGLRKHHAGINQDGGVAAGDHHHVHAELAEAAERKDLEWRRRSSRRIRAVVQTMIPALKLLVEGEALTTRRSWRTVVAARGWRRGMLLHPAGRWDGTPGTSKTPQL